jgi:hypothetical protein
MENKKITLFVKSGLVILALIFIVYFLYVSNLPKFPTYGEAQLPEGVSEQQYEDSPIVNGYKTYSNSTIGLSFEYPADWRIEKNNTFEDPVTHGDIMKDGKVYTTFFKAILPPDWGQSSVAIQFSHPTAIRDGKEYDNLPIEEQLKYTSCSSAYKGETCKELTNKNGLKYTKYNLCDKEWGCIMSVIFPTGKYVMEFDIQAEDFKKIPEKVKVFDDLINSIELE